MAILPPLPDREMLTELCHEVAGQQEVQPFAVEKDFYLTRLIRALAQHFGDGLLLKGGTLLSKVDLGYRRMSEDVDLVIPWDRPVTHGGINAARINSVARALRDLASEVGVQFTSFDGERFEKNAQAIWELPYDSPFGSQSIDVEVSLRLVLRPARRPPLRQLLTDTLIGDYRDAFCWALDADEARAEKVRAAFTRRESRDFYDLDQLLDTGADFESPAFQALVDAKLLELGEPPLNEQSASFGLSRSERKQLAGGGRKGLQAVVRSASEFNLERMLARFDTIWGKTGQADH